MNTNLSTSDQLSAQIDQRWNSLTKPPGSLGRLEEMVRRLGVIQGTPWPKLERKAMFVFCADHGVADAGVSAFPQEVTPQMVRNFVTGGAAISVLCRRFSIESVVVDAGVKGPAVKGALNRRIAGGTKNFCEQPAMSREQAEQALDIGRQLARESAGRFDIVAAGEMGIANTTSAAALLTAFSGIDPELTVGRGTGVDDNGIRRKIDAVRRAMLLHAPEPTDPIGVLSAVGGFEIGAIAGLVLGAAEAGLAVVLDGFISCSAALIAKAFEPECLNSVFFSHQSAEAGHHHMLDCLGVEPYFSLDMRLGEGTGAALTINLLESALLLYNEMATFQDANVSTSSE